MTRMLFCLVLLPGLNCSAAQERTCELNALRVLPLDNPDAISVGDTRELVKNLKSCREIVREFPGDAGR